MTVKCCDQAEDRILRFAVIIARSGGKWVLCKHRERDTLEIPGGRREPGEDIGWTAVQELREETGAKNFSIRSICAYAVVREREESFGMLYYADIRSFSPELHSEIEQVFLLETLPENWTYPDIQPVLLREAARRGVL